MAHCTEAITISVSTQSGDDPVPLFAAGDARMSCVVGIESLATIDIQQAVFSNTSTNTGTATYGNLTISDPIVKESMQASSGTPYFTAGKTFVGRTNP